MPFLTFLKIEYYRSGYKCLNIKIHRVIILILIYKNKKISVKIPDS